VPSNPPLINIFNKPRITNFFAGIKAKMSLCSVKMDSFRREGNLFLILTGLTILLVLKGQSQMFELGEKCHGEKKIN
jgi:hypothetical protein